MSFWIQTALDMKFDFDDPQVHLADVGLALARQCRFAGHCQRHYSVAEHSLLMASRFSSPRMALHMLLHDAHEAFMGDITAPMKAWLAGQTNGSSTEAFDLLEGRINKELYRDLGVPQPTVIEKKEIRTADLRMLATEKRDLFAIDPAWPVLKGYEPFLFSIPRQAPDPDDLADQWCDYVTRAAGQAKL